MKTIGHCIRANCIAIVLKLNFSNGIGLLWHTNNCYWIWCWSFTISHLVSITVGRRWFFIFLLAHFGAISMNFDVHRVPIKKMTVRFDCVHVLWWFCVCLTKTIGPNNKNINDDSSSSDGSNQRNNNVTQNCWWPRLNCVCLFVIENIFFISKMFYCMVCFKLKRVCDTDRESIWFGVITHIIIIAVAAALCSVLSHCVRSALNYHCSSLLRE